MLDQIHTIGATIAAIVVAAISAEMPLFMLLLQRIAQR
jgi:hypothetical protein